MKLKDVRRISKILRSGQYQEGRKGYFYDGDKSGCVLGVLSLDAGIDCTPDLWYGWRGLNNVLPQETPSDLELEAEYGFS